MSNSIVATIYTSVINDVIQNVKKDFEDSGVGEDVLNSLHAIWKEKVKSARVAPWDQNDGILEEPNQIMSGIPSTSNPYSQPPSNPPNDPMTKGETAAANLSLVATQTIITDNNSNGIGRVPYLPQIKNGNSLPSTTTNDNIPKYGMMYDNQQTEVASHNNTVVDQNLSYIQTMRKQQEADMYIEQRIKEKNLNVLGESTREVPTQPPQQPPQPPQQPPPQQPPRQPVSQQPPYDLANRESRQTDVFSGEDVINSDLDDSDDEAATEGEDTQNIILCLYDKVTRTKNKWKCQLKDGIMSVNGRDFLFQKGNGDFEF